LSFANFSSRSWLSFQSPASDQPIGLPLVRSVRMMVIVPSTSSSAISWVNTGAFLRKISAASARLSKLYCQPRWVARRKRRSWSWFFGSLSQSLLVMIALESVVTPAMS
jgi:hypothetical protein